MWNNKEVRKRARTTLKANYWTLVGLCFVLVFIGVLSGFGSNALTESNSNPVEMTGLSDGSTQAEEAETDSTSESAPGLTKYLGAFLEGKEAAAKVGQELIGSYAGTGGNAFKVFLTIDKFIVANDWAARVIIILGTIFFLAYYLLFRNALLVGYMRVLEETRAYSKTKFLRVFYVFKLEDFWNVVKVMLIFDLFITVLLMFGLLPLLLGVILVGMEKSGLWLIGGLIVSVVLTLLVLRKYYELYFIPNILAINPAASWKECVALSKGITEGNKLHFLGLQFSFAGWTLLSLLTLGLLDIFFLRPYMYQAETEVFMVLRDKAMAEQMAYAYLLKDDYLTCPEPEKIEGDINADHGLFEEIYPDREPRPVNRLAKYISDLNPKRDYSVLNIVMLFFSFAIGGWLWEVSLYLVQHGVFINRGTLHGPWLPIYGWGGILIIILLRRFSDKPVKTAFLSLLLCGALEYGTSLYLELVKGQRWWDYSNYFLNINGRVCFEGLLVFVIAGMAAIYLVGPLLDNVYKKVPAKKKLAVAAVLIMFYAGDKVYSHYHPNTGLGITQKLQSQTQQVEITDIETQKRL